MSRLIRVLSIDGGGIRGIIPGQILIDLEKKIQEKSENPDARIADYFDFFSGTSTGGILTLILLCPGENGRPRYSAKEAVDIYLKRGGEIFSRSIYHLLSSFGGLTDEKYSQYSFEKTLKEYFDGIKLSELLKPCLITSYETDKRYAHFFSQTDARTRPGYDFFIRDVARATSAAPTFFEAAKIISTTGVSYSLIDGGVFANNPALCAFSEVSKLFRKEKPITVDEVLMLSLGTGNVKKPYIHQDIKDWGAVGWMKPVLDIMSTGVSETVEFQMGQIFQSMGNKDRYIRINPDLLHAKPEMDNVQPDNLKALKEAGIYCAERHFEVLDKLASQVVEIGIKTYSLT